MYMVLIDDETEALVMICTFQKGCSIRLLNPQTFSRNVWLLNTSLQEFFGCSVGANMYVASYVYFASKVFVIFSCSFTPYVMVRYLTPPGSQGFAPHYDDIEAFVIQLEGQKQWKLYNPR